MHVTEKVYGAAAAFEKRLDRSVLETVARAPGLPSSHMLLDAHLGRAHTIDVEDYLNCELLLGICGGKSE